MGRECIGEGPLGDPLSSETLCIGRDVWAVTCPFDAIHIHNTPEADESGLCTGTATAASDSISCRSRLPGESQASSDPMGPGTRRRSPPSSSRCSSALLRTRTRRRIYGSGPTVIYLQGAAYDRRGTAIPAAWTEANPIPLSPRIDRSFETASSDRGALDALGRYHAWGTISYTIVGTYVVLLLIVVLILGRGSAVLSWWGSYVISGILLVALARYLSTNYRIDERYLRARRILGGVKVRLDQVRSIEYASLRDLAATGGFFGSWGWRGRMWSPVLGRFDSIYTDAARGLLVTAGEYPLYLSPRQPDRFARELSRRVRSYSGRLAVDVGDPLASPPVETS